jgi:hypothetical protein
MLHRCLEIESKVGTALRNKFTPSQLTRWKYGQKAPPTIAQALVIQKITAELGPDGAIELSYWAPKSVATWCEKGDVAQPFTEALRIAVHHYTPSRLRSSEPRAAVGA